MCCCAKAENSHFENLLSAGVCLSAQKSFILQRFHSDFVAFVASRADGIHCCSKWMHSAPRQHLIIGRTQMTWKASLDCMPSAVGLSCGSWGLTWHIGRPLLQVFAGQMSSMRTVLVRSALPAPSRPKPKTDASVLTSQIPVVKAATCRREWMHSAPRQHLIIGNNTDDMKGILRLRAVGRPLSCGT